MRDRNRPELRKNTALQIPWGPLILRVGGIEQVSGEEVKLFVCRVLIATETMEKESP